MIKHEGEYTSSDLAKLGIKRERLKEWIKRGYVEPTIQKGDGTGHWHLFSRSDLYLLELFKYLLSRGFSRKEAHRRVKHIVTPGLKYAPDVDVILFYNKGESDDDILIDFLKEGDKVAINFQKDYWCDLFAVNFRRIRNHVDSVID